MARSLPPLDPERSQNSLPYMLRSSHQHHGKTKATSDIALKKKQLTRTCVVLVAVAIGTATVAFALLLHLLRQRSDAPFSNIATTSQNEAIPETPPLFQLPTVAVPTKLPTSGPTAKPLPSPTQKPTAGAPTASPTILLVDPNPVPDEPPRGYFNYDDNTPYGPSRWNRVDTRDHFLREFDRDGFGIFEGHLAANEPLLNRCGGPDRNQSPKNLVGTTECRAHHEIRTRCGREELQDTSYVTKQILSNKLSLVFSRRACLNPNDSSCEDGRPPTVDYPRYSSGTTPWSDLLNMDFKVPGEHTLEGEVFDAEIQMLHTHLQSYPSRASSIGIPIRATTDGHNDEFQKILNEFQSEYDSHREGCRRRRRLGGQERPSYLNETFAASTTRQLEPLVFDPYSYALMPGIHFYRYDGSMTEPPCLRITWWVMSEPMIISYSQLQQMKHILFTNVDAETCQRTSVHNANQEVSRPIQPLGDERDIEKCDERDFVSDIDKGHNNEGRRC